MDIIGYRQLSDIEIETINSIKEQANNLGEAMKAFEALPAIDKRWLAIAKTHFQQGTMAWIRAVAKPEGF